MKSAIFLVIFLTIIACNYSSNRRETSSHDTKSNSDTIFSSISYSTIHSIFKKNCFGCHSGSNPADELDLTTYEGVINGTSHGWVITVGNPNGSVMIDALLGSGGAKEDIVEHVNIAGKFPDADVKAISTWIKEGAQPDGTAKERVFAVLKLYVIYLDNAEQAYFRDYRRFTSSLDSLGITTISDIKIIFDYANRESWRAKISHPLIRSICIANGSSDSFRELNLTEAIRFCSDIQ